MRDKVQALLYQARGNYFSESYDFFQYSTNGILYGSYRKKTKVKEGGEEDSLLESLLELRKLENQFSDQANDDQDALRQVSL